MMGLDKLNSKSKGIKKTNKDIPKKHKQHLNAHVRGNNSDEN